jgi:phosphate transport system substrate-binding protein
MNDRRGERRHLRHILLIGVLCVVATLPAGALEILGSGSTFAYPVLTKWSEAYEKISGDHIEYQPVGSSAGITEITSGIVDIGVTDVPLDDAQLLRDGLAQFPMVIGAIVPVVNIDGITSGQLRFTGQLLADIYLGKVKNWNDAAIAAVNPGITLPNRAIFVVYRSDGSGTTYNWADYLSKVSDDWKVRIGEGTKLAWPTGAGAKGNGGVADYVARVKGAIGYVEYTYALHAKLNYGLVRNRAGKFVSPDAMSFQAATENVDWAKDRDFYVFLSDAPGTNAYPIMATSFALVRRYPRDGVRSRATLAFFRWAMEDGRELASSVQYLPIPPSLVRQVEAYWEEQIRVPE